jgi:hypothetical protein
MGGLFGLSCRAGLATHPCRYAVVAINHISYRAIARLFSRFVSCRLLTKSVVG